MSLRVVRLKLKRVLVKQLIPRTKKSFGGTYILMRVKHYGIVAKEKGLGSLSVNAS